MIPADVLKRIQAAPPAERAALFALFEERERQAQIIKARENFLDYVKWMWPGFIGGKHHKRMADAFDRVLRGELKRLIINLGPRHTKSEFASKFLPSKFMGMYPDKKVIQATHTADFSKAWGRKTRNIIASPRFKELYPGTELVADAKAAGKWDTEQGGEYNAVGTGGGVAGKGADLFIIDDPHTEQDYIRAKDGDASAFEDVYTWYQTGPRQRLQPGAAIVIVMTRWHMRDLTGKLIARMASDPLADQWEIIELPALMPDTDLPIWPEFWPEEELKRTRAGLSPAQWNAQYMQNPTSEEAAIVKREWWREWPKEKAPKCEYIIQSWDTAFTKKETADYSACTTWGVFDHPNENGETTKNIILLDAYRERMEFPKLKQTAYDMYVERQPDAFIVEAKASGLPLIMELRQMGIPVAEFTPSRGNDKTVRLNAISDMFCSGMVWYPPFRWAEEVIDEVASFPAGEHDDYVDSTTQALLRFRQGGFIPIPSDADEEPYYRKPFSPY